LPLGLKVAYLFSLAGLVLAGVLWPTIPMAGLWSACVVTFLMLGNLQVIWRQRSHLRRLILWPTLVSISGICLGLLLRIGLLLLSLSSETHVEGWYYLSNLTGLLVVMIGGIGMAMSFWLLITDRMVYALRQIAERDPLTGIFNRRGFQRTVDQLLARQPNTLTVMMLDIDHFKRVNDRFGHAAGDQVLVCMGDILRDALRASDIFARLGGEEFCVVMHDRSLHTAKDVGERIRRRFARRTALLEAASACTLSVGVAYGEAGQYSLAELMARADLALYRCKASGRDQLQVYDSSHDRWMNDDDEPFPWH
jgi:diguanylate cyclase (GGDEF)-like protein